MDIMQLCRLCLVKDQVNIPIFGEQGDIRQIFLKITACLPVKVSKEDNLPKKICDGCLYKLELLYQFWNTTVNAEKQLLEWLNQAGLDANKKATDGAMAVVNDVQDAADLVLKEEAIDITEVRGDEEDDLSTEANSYILQQQQLPYQTFEYQQDGTKPSDDSIAAAAEETTQPPAKRQKVSAAPAQTIVNPETESDDDIDTTEMKLTKVEDDSDGENPEPTTFVGVDNEQPGPSGVGKTAEAPSDNSILRQLICGPSMTVEMTSFDLIMPTQLLTMELNEETSKLEVSSSNPPLKVKNLEKIKADSKVKAKKPKDSGTSDASEAVHCEICDVTFENNIAFGLHSIIHNDNQKYTCHMCKYSSASKYHFEMHIKAHEGKTKYKCDICNKAFTVSTHAIEHKYFHTGEKPFQCEICGKHFMFSWFLASHRRTQHWEIMTGMPLVKYDCTICNKHYTSSTGLKRHNLSNHNEAGIDPSVLCDVCGKRLSSKEKLKFHRRIHTGYKPFGCTACSKSFTRKEQLKEHERVHTGEKPHICRFCGKGFTQRSPVKIHERIHTGERPYICRLCGKGFISKGVMDTHMKNCDGMPVVLSSVQ